MAASGSGNAKWILLLGLPCAVLSSVLLTEKLWEVIYVQDRTDEAEISASFDGAETTSAEMSDTSTEQTTLTEEPPNSEELTSQTETSTAQYETSDGADESYSISSDTPIERVTETHEIISRESVLICNGKIEIGIIVQQSRDRVAFASPNPFPVTELIERASTTADDCVLRLDRIEQGTSMLDRAYRAHMTSTLLESES